MGRPESWRFGLCGADMQTGIVAKVANVAGGQGRNWVQYEHLVLTRRNQSGHIFQSLDPSDALRKSSGGDDART